VASLPAPYGRQRVMAARLVEVEDRGPVRWVMMNRPEVHNAQNAALLRELEDAFRDAANDASLRVLVLGGHGKSFSAGHDLNEVVANPEYRANLKSVEGRLWQELDLFVRPLELLRSLRIPTVCRVQGYCVAAAIMLLMATDLVVAADDAIFWSSVTRDMGVDDVEVSALAWALGERRAKQVLWTSERLDAHRAAQFGLVNWVVPVDELDAKISQVTDELLKVPRDTLALSKASLRFMEDRRGRADAEAYHFLSHQLSHGTTAAQSLLRHRIDQVGDVP
jgi:enoyl-CoA hydratase/carnithine racemase